VRRVARGLLPALALLLLAAHFFRAGLPPLAALCVTAVGLLFVRATWAARTLQALLGLGTLEWIRTAWVFATARAAAGQPYGRLLAILGLVALVTVVSAVILRGTDPRRH
jgi:hypothetical protein